MMLSYFDDIFYDLCRNSYLSDCSFSDEDISEAEKEVRELDKARRKLLLEVI
jgi:hypothetical protein